MRVIGTAGHVDHGKSALVEALTGIHPDRLKEEKEREMTIDLGFAWLTLPNGEEVGIVDVPGHRDFIENMLAGVGGIDAALLVIAADEGVMPQTREHLNILDLLQVKNGVVALSKVDLIEDREWLDLVEDEARLALAGTVLSSAPIVRVSVRSGEGLPQLLNALSDLLVESPMRPDYGRPRLPIDRVFSIAGFGTVVTGTLLDGELHVGDEIEILPDMNTGRIRGLQTHKRKEVVSVPGSRTAVNLTGLGVDQIHRGDVMAHPGDYQTTTRLDVRFRLLPDASRSLKHNTETKLFIGAAEIQARIRLLGQDELHPGQEGWLQLELNQPVTAVRGDRYILRRPSPGETLGGGIVIDPHPNGRYKRFSGQTLARLESLAKGSPAEVLYQSLSSGGIAPLKDVIVSSHLDHETAMKAAEELVAQRQLVDLEFSPSDKGEQAGSDSSAIKPKFQDLVSTRAAIEQLTSRAVKEVESYHRSYPLRTGIPREELKSRLQLSARVFNALLRMMVNDNSVIESELIVRLPSHEIKFTLQQQRSVQELLERFSNAPYSPPSIKECQSETSEEIYNALVETRRLIPVSSEVVFSQEGYNRMLQELQELFKANETLSAAQVRDHFNTSRRYVLALLEHLDRIGVTSREGDVRRLKK